MNPQELHNLYKRMSDQKICLAFKGAISQEVLVELGTIVRNRIGFDGKLKRVFAIFIEMTQNILHYSAEKEYLPANNNHAGVGIIIVSESADYYHVCSGNMAEKSEAEQLAARCAHINSLNSAQLKDLYNKNRNSPVRKGSKGAGLGLIDIARKSDKPLEYSVNPMDDQYSFFTLTALISKN